MPCKQDDPKQDTTAEPWAKHYDPVEVAPEVSLEAQLSDEQGKFNVNTLLKKDGTPNEPAVKVFNQLLKLLEMDSRWSSLLIDWMDRNTLPESEGGEDSLYASQTPPHRTANLLVTSISELQQMPGFNRELYLRLAPFVTALPPTANKINVCTADREVLDALYAVSAADTNDVEYTRMRPEDLAANRARGCFPTVDVLSRGDTAMRELAGEQSNYFRLRTWVRIGTAQFALYSLMYREGGMARPISRTFGTE